MVSVLRDFFSTCGNQRLASIAITSVCFLCIPLNISCNEGLTESRDILDAAITQIKDDNPAGLIEKLDQLENRFEASNDPLEEGRKFLKNFINDINGQYSLSLTIQDACVLIEENLHILELPEEFKRIILNTVDLYKTDSRVPEIEKNTFRNNFIDGSLSRISLSLYWPWEWSFFGLNKSKKHKHYHSELINYPCQIANPIDPTVGYDLPSNCYFGGAEMLAGALVCLVPLPGAVWLGRLMIADGTRRVIDGTIELGEERRDPSYVRPPNPPGFKF